MRSRILDWGREIGLSHVGIAPADGPPPRAVFLRDWLARGFHASMDYLAKDPDARSDPGRILEGCRSVICCALDYEDQLPDPAKGKPELARIARYAWGDDYHDVLGEKLRTLADRIRAAWPDARTRVAVDTSPVLEKAFAASAGLGWIGKHGCLIHPDRGSFFFLGEIFTTLDLQADEPADNRCGSCQRCIDACPTGAIVEPGVVDARLCLAYWTIEHRGSIDETLHAPMANWVFGCDVCQDVCHWNKKKAASSADPCFAPRAANLGRPLAEWSGIAIEEFRARFRGSAVKRARHDGFIRNVKIAARNAAGAKETNP